MVVNRKIELLSDRIIQALAILTVIAYVLSVTGAESIPDRLLRPFAFMLGSFGIIAILNIYHTYSFPQKRHRYYKTSLVFLVLAFFQLTMMVVVQQSISYYSNTLDASSRDTRVIFILINSIQLGMDVVFDIFYSVGVILMSLCFVFTDVKSVLGWYGILTAVLLFTLNFIAFPVPPKSAGYFDMGVLTIPWWGLLIWTIKKQSNI